MSLISDAPVFLLSRLLLPPGDCERLLVHPGSVWTPPQIWKLPGIHRAADAGQQEGVHEERRVLLRPKRYWEETGALLRLHAHQKTLLPPKEVRATVLRCLVLLSVPAVKLTQGDSGGSSQSGVNVMFCEKCPRNSSFLQKLFLFLLNQKGNHVCAAMSVYSSDTNNAYLHPKWRQSPVWEEPQGSILFVLNRTVDLKHF